MLTGNSAHASNTVTVVLGWMAASFPNEQLLCLHAAGGGSDSRRIPGMCITKTADVLPNVTLESLARCLFRYKQFMSGTQCGKMLMNVQCSTQEAQNAHQSFCNMHAYFFSMHASTPLWQTEVQLHCIHVCTCMLYKYL